MPTEQPTTATATMDVGITTTIPGMVEPPTTGLSTNDPARTGTITVEAETMESTTGAETTTTDLGKYN